MNKTRTQIKPNVKLSVLRGADGEVSSHLKPALRSSHCAYSGPARR